MSLIQPFLVRTKLVSHLKLVQACGEKGARMLMLPLGRIALSFETSVLVFRGPSSGRGAGGIPEANGGGTLHVSSVRVDPLS